MSYEIIYDKQFIKVKEDKVEKFCPIILTGSNNCYDMNNRRARSWWNWTYFTNGGGFATLEEMLAKTQSEKERIKAKERDSEFSDENWGYYTALSFGGGCKATFGQYEGIFKTGAKKAVTVEQLKDVSYASVFVCSGYYEKEQIEKAGLEPFSYLVETSKELVEKFREAEKYLEGTGLKPQIRLDASEEVAKRIRARLFKKPLKEKKLVEVDFYYVVKDFDEGNYISRTRRNGYSYAYTKNGAKHFRLKSQAKRYANKLSLKYGKEGRFITEIVNEKTSFKI